MYWDKKKDLLTITKISNQHSHEILEEESYKLYPQNRKMNQEEEIIVRDMIKSGGDAKLIAELIEEKTGKRVIPEQIHNIKHKYQAIDVGNHSDDIKALKKVLI